MIEWLYPDLKGVRLPDKVCRLNVGKVCKLGFITVLSTFVINQKSYSKSNILTKKFVQILYLPAMYVYVIYCLLQNK